MNVWQLTMSGLDDNNELDVRWWLFWRVQDATEFMKTHEILKATEFTHVGSEMYVGTVGNVNVTLLTEEILGGDELVQLRAEIERLQAENATLRAERDARSARPTEWVLKYRIEQINDTEEASWQTEVFDTIDAAVFWANFNHQLRFVPLAKWTDEVYGGRTIAHDGTVITVRIQGKGEQR